MRGADEILFCSKKMTELQWQFCAESSALLPDKMIEALAGEKRVCLLRKGERLFAFAASCPHAGAPLCEGRVDAKGRVVCPLHGYRFNPANGYNASGEGYKLKTYPVKEEEGRIFVQL